MRTLYVKPSMETKIPPVISLFLIGIVLIVLAAKLGHLLGTGITIFFYIVGFIIVGSIIYTLIRNVFS